MFDLHQIPVSIPAPDEQRNYPLQIFTLGRFSVARGVEPIRFARKAQHRPLQLLKALIALGGREVGSDRLGMALWPESEGDLAHQSFASTVLRLRQLTGDEKAILLREGRLTLSDRHCWVDATAFERLSAQAESGQKGVEEKDGVARQVRLLEKAIALYKGPFLPGETKHPWAVSLRERLRSKFLRAVGTLGRHWENEAEWEKAIDCYRKGIEVDNLAEEFYRHLMICYQRLGRDAEARATYLACRRILSSILGVQPSPKTVAVIEAVSSD